MTCILDQTYSCPYEELLSEAEMTCEECEVCKV